MEQRQRMMALINQAREGGVKKTMACEVPGVSVRTIQRWETEDSPGDGRQGVSRTAHNRLRDVEREMILQVVNRPEFADLPPSQIVPRLADEGRCLASESTIYRLLRAADQLRHRHATRLEQHAATARLHRHGPESTLQLGHHLFTVRDTRGVFLLLPVHGYLQPQDRRLASPCARVQRTGGRIVGGHLSTGRH